MEMDSRMLGCWFFLGLPCKHVYFVVWYFCQGLGQLMVVPCIVQGLQNGGDNDLQIKGIVSVKKGKF